MKNRIASLISTSDNLQKAAAKSEIMASSVNSLNNKLGIRKPEELRQDFNDLLTEDRLMNVGIVGRVKAGKSSLLNALFFDGKNILPSAATPMTAALTTITYGDKFSASAELYSENDVVNIKLKAQEYTKSLEKEIFELTDKQLKRKKPLTEESRNKIQHMAERKMQRDMVLSSAYDQYQRMQASGMMNNLQDNNTIQANSLEELASSLLDFVGSEGKLMPFTKSVNITLPIESLKDIRVIDTPGFNDPVQSREERTVELLKKCDVIFIVSPSGQFLSEQDLDMVGRITKREGVQEIKVIASQVDMQFFGSEKRDTVQETLDAIVSNLSKHMADALNKLKESSPEVGTTFDNLIEDSNKHLIYSSGICHSISQKIQNQQELNQAESHVWSMLLEGLPNSFSKGDSKLTSSSLAVVANIEKVKQVIAEVRAQKDKIMQESLEKKVAQTNSLLAQYKEEILKLTAAKINDISGSDIESIRLRIKQNIAMQGNIEDSIDQVYSDLIKKLKKNTRDNIVRVIDGKFKEVYKKVENSQEEGSSKRTVKKTGAINWLGRLVGIGGTREVTDTFIKVNTPHVVRDVDHFFKQVQEDISEAVDNNEDIFKREIKSKVFKSYREAIADDELVDEGLARGVISDLADKDLPMIQYEATIKVPKNLRGKGVLKSQKAEDFINDIDEFINSQKSVLSTKVNNYRDSLINGLPKSISEQFTTGLSKEIIAFKGQVENKRISLDRLKSFESNIMGVEV